jgi:hypothetical protein
MLFYAKGNFRNWDRLEVKRPVECLWCGHQWASVVPIDPVCPKCNMTNNLAKKLLGDPAMEKSAYLSHKCRAMKNKFK